MAPKRRNKQRYHPYGESALLSAETLQFIEEETTRLYNKRFTLKAKDKQCELPSSELLFTTTPETINVLQEMKRNLNESKSMLNDIDIVEWHQHTRRTHKAGLVVKTLRETMRAEMCTQAFAKLYEVLASYNVVPTEAVSSKKLYSVHLCEAPGAFIAATNHYLGNHHPDLEWAWLGATLNPYYEGHSPKALLDDDRFIVETLQNWDFGADGTGDLMQLENLNHLAEACQGKVHLVTADGSIDCSDEPEEQENAVSQLIFCEAVTALTVLATGGCYVFKMFTTLEHHMVCLMYLMCCLFEEVHVIKPGTSKGGNSEVYITCCGYTGNLSPQYHEILYTAYQQDTAEKVLFPLNSIPREFLYLIKECQEYFINLQNQEISMNIQYFHHMNRLEKKQLFHLRKQAAGYYMEKFGVQPIAEEERVVLGAYLDGTQLSFTRGPSFDVPIKEPFCGRGKTGTYNERHDVRYWSWLESMQRDGVFVGKTILHSSLKELVQTANGNSQLIPLTPEDVEWLTSPITPLQCTSEMLQTSIGKPIDQVRNSRFCTLTYVSKLIEAKNEAMILRAKNADDFKRITQGTSPMWLSCDAKKLDHYCNLPSLIELEKLVSFTKGVKNIAAVTVTGHSGCDCAARYLKSCNLQVKISSQGMQQSEHGIFGSRKRQGNGGQPSSDQLPSEINIARHAIKISEESEKRKMSEERGPSGDGLVGLVVSLIGSRASADQASLREPKELLNKKQLLQQCVFALRNLSTGGTFVCQVFDTLTRFSVGLIYILHYLFSRVAIVKPVIDHLWSPVRYLVCEGYQDRNEEVVTYLEGVLANFAETANQSIGENRSTNQIYDPIDLSDEVSKSTKNVSQVEAVFTSKEFVRNETSKNYKLEILELIPMSYLYENRFYQFVKKANERLSHLQIQSLVLLEMCHQEPHLEEALNELMAKATSVRC